MLIKLYQQKPDKKMNKKKFFCKCDYTTSKS